MDALTCARDPPQHGPNPRAGAHQKGDTMLRSGAHPKGKGIGGFFWGQTLGQMAPWEKESGKELAWIGPCPWDAASGPSLVGAQGRRGAARLLG